MDKFQLSIVSDEHLLKKVSSNPAIQDDIKYYKSILESLSIETKAEMFDAIISHITIGREALNYCYKELGIEIEKSTKLESENQFI